MDKQAAPLYEQLVKTHFRRQANFHVPGHKGGRGLDPAGVPFFDAIAGIDYTEIAGLDDLHHPEGVILQAQQLAADLFGAEETHFLVGGSTVGNLALITTVCRRDDLLIVQRNVHKSVINGLMLARARAVFVSPRYERESGLAACVDPRDIEEALIRYPQAKGVLVTNPNYYGMGLDLRGLSELVHRFGVPLLVDEAHGAHFGFHPKLPASALQCGADGVVQSTHKMMGAMTMGAMLHIQGSLIDREKLKQRLSMLQSSSPSYPIMASLDLSRRLFQKQGQEMLEKALGCLADFRNELHGIEGIGEIRSALTTEAYDYMDPFKICVFDKSQTLNGFAMRELLEQQGCTAEMADPRHVLLMASYATDENDLKRLLQALRHLSQTYRLGRNDLPERCDALHRIPEQTDIGMPVGFDMDAKERPTARMPVEEAAGYTAAEMIVPYPPGIPLLYVGETITPAIQHQLAALAEAGARFQGKAADEARIIKVYAKE